MHSDDTRSQQHGKTGISSKSGFTLVELSIVLVIIGLLIGGILVAKSMIQTAKIQKYIRDLQQYEIAITNFKTNYKLAPGDTPYFTPAGNSNGVYDALPGESGNCIPSNISGHEIFHAWAHLSQGGMIKGDFQPYAPVSCGGTQPIWRFSDNIAFPNYSKVDYTTSIGPAGDYTIGYGESTLEARFNFVLNFFDAVSMDAKLDDGVSSTGAFTASTVDINDTLQPLETWLANGNDLEIGAECYWIMPPK